MFSLFVATYCYYMLLLILATACYYYLIGHLSLLYMTFSLLCLSSLFLPPRASFIFAHPPSWCELPPTCKFYHQCLQAEAANKNQVPSLSICISLQATFGLPHFSPYKVATSLLLPWPLRLIACSPQLLCFDSFFFVFYLRRFCCCYPHAGICFFEDLGKVEVLEYRD